MNEIIPYVWISVIVFAAVAEIYTLVKIPLWFIPSAFAVFILSLTKMQVWIQVALFFIITSILLVLSRIILKNFTKFKFINFAPELSFIGRNAIVTEEINNYRNMGAVRINGFICKAKAEDDDIIYESGLVVTVTGTDGLKAVCSR